MATMGYGDTRKVQTAVLGGPDSDHPVFLPFEHELFDDFIVRHEDGVFFCGVLLGGCGKQLAPKRYTDRVCHFAHYPPVRCPRTAAGEDSADHLFIGQALQQWLASQQQPGARLRYLADSIDAGDAVMVDVPDGHTILVEMTAAASSLAEQEGERTVVRAFGPRAPVPASEFDHRGYALRFQCRSEGGTRKVLVGTHLRPGDIKWTSLKRCTWTTQGILTPDLELDENGIRPAEVPRARLSFPLALRVAAFSGAVLSGETAGHRTYDARAQTHGSAAFDARIFLPRHAYWPTKDRVYVLTGLVRIEPGLDSGADVPEWTIRADNVEQATNAEVTAWGALAAMRLRTAPAPSATSESAQQTKPPRARQPEEDADPTQTSLVIRSRPHSPLTTAFPNPGVLDTLPYEHAPEAAISQLSDYFKAAKTIDDYTMILEIRRHLKAMRPRGNKPPPKGFTELWRTVDKHSPDARWSFASIRQITADFVSQRDQVQRGRLMVWLHEARELVDTEVDRRAVAWMEKVLGLDAPDAS